MVLGAEGVQMGTRMVSAAESPVHEAYKRLICDSSEADSLLLNRFAQPAFRVLRTEHSTALERSDPVPLGELGGQLDLYFGGDLGSGLAFGGQVAGRIGEIAPVAEILRDTVAECERTLGEVATRWQ